MKKKPKPTPEEIAAKEEMKIFSKRFNALKATIKSLCGSQGLRKMELQLEFIKSNPKTPLPKEYFDHAQTIRCYELAIEEYKIKIHEAAA